MAKLTIYRGEALDRELELGETTLRIGRGEGNEIILDDPNVSRLHAEVRFENGQYTVVDNHSRNGLWVAGNQVQTTPLAPGVPVLIGSHLFVLTDAAADAEGAAMTIPYRPGAAMPPPKPAAQKPAPNVPASPHRGTAPTPASEMPKAVPVARQEPAKPAEKPAAPPPKAAPEPEAPPVAAKPVPSAAPAKPAAAAESPAPKPAPAKHAAVEAPAAKPAAAAAPAVAAQAAKPAASKSGGGWLTRQRMMYGGIAAALVLALGGATWFFVLRGGPEPETTTAEQSTPPAQPPAAVTPPAPVEVAPPPVATPPPPAPAPAPPPPAPRAERRETPPAPARPRPTPPTPVAAASPAPKPPEPGAQVAAPAPPPAPAPAPAPAAPANQAAPQRGRGGRQTPVNPDVLFEQARTAMVKGDYLTSVSLLEQVLRVSPNYPRAENLLGVARSGAKNASQLAIDAGNKAELSGDFATAKKQYDLALQLDPQSPSVGESQRRLKVRMQSEGEQAFQRGKLLYSQVGRETEATTQLQRALELLPPDHKDVKTAQEWLATLKSGR